MGQEESVPSEKGHLSGSRKHHIFDEKSNGLPPSEPRNQLIQDSGIKKISSQHGAIRIIPAQNTPVHSMIQQKPAPLAHSINIQRSEIDSINYSDIPPADRYPTKIPYYNAWSLPIQKYYIEERGQFQGEEEEEGIQVERREVREFNSQMLQQIMAQKMKQEVNTQYRKRRQNLNMV